MKYIIKILNLQQQISVHIFNRKVLSLIGSAELSEFLVDGCENKFYFSRLFVKPKFRRKKFAHTLMREVIKIIDQRKIDIILEINPYGDLSYKQLVKFYQKYNFELNDDGDCFIRKHQKLKENNYYD